MQSNKIHILSIHNFIDKDSIDENEDAVAFVEEPLFEKIAVSDGAGGAGIYCKTWANYLVSNQPDLPFQDKTKADEWFLYLSESFYKKNIELINKMDSFIVEKFIKEGSYATLFFAWWNKETNVLKYIGVGDTTLLVFRKVEEIYTPILISPINDQYSLDDFPKLVNWNRELNYDLSTQEIELKSCDIVIICTDSIARWIIYQLIILVPQVMETLLSENIFKNININKLEEIKFLNIYKDVSDLLLNLIDILDQGLDCFKEVLDQQIKLNLLEKDDFTIFFKRI